MSSRGSRFPSTVLVATALLAALIAQTGTPSRADGEKATDKGTFMKVYGDWDSHAAGKAIEALNPNVKGDYDLLKMVLQTGNWYHRSIAMKVLAKTGNKKNLEDMLDSLVEKGEKSPMVRQGMAEAIAKMNDRELYPRLFAALSDKDARVRRHAAYVLRINKDKGSIEALIKRWKDEKDPIVINYIRESLEDITKRFLGAEQIDWYNWWEAVKDKFEVGSTDEEAKKKAEEEGKKLTEGGTQARDVDLTYVSRGIGMPVVVLAEYGHSKELSIPFFYELEKAAKLYYMSLPKVASFKNLKQIAGYNYYPIDQLVEAFEEFRKQTKSDKIAIMASGMNSWIAMKYAQKYPRNVACLVFIAPISGEPEYGKVGDRMIKQGQEKNDIELWHLGLQRSFNTQTGESSHDIFHKEKKFPETEGHMPALGRKDFSVYFADQQDSLLDQLYPIHEDHPGSVAIPPFSILKEKVSPVPTMICMGKFVVTTSETDCQATAKHYGAALVTFDRSSGLPQCEEPEKFNKSVVSFLKKYAKKVPGSSKEEKKS